MKMHPIIEVHGDSYEVGFQYGSKCTNLICERLEVMRQLFNDKILFDFGWRKAIQKSKKYIPFIEKYDSELIEEMKGVASGANLSLDEILFLNVVYEFFSRRTPGVWNRCTTLFVKSEVTTNGIVIIGQNDDWNEIFRPFIVLLKIEQKSRPKIMQVCDAGTIGGNGINNYGVALCANSLLSGDWTFEGIPHLLIKRGALKSKNMAEAIAAITSSTRSSSHNYLLGHSEGEGIDIESTPTDCNFIFPANGFITHTNHFVIRTPHIQDNKVMRSPDTLVRKERADTILSHNIGKITLETIKHVFTDHFSKPHSICRHPNTQFSPPQQMQTNASMIIDMTNRILHISNGPPCENDYIIHKID